MYQSYVGTTLNNLGALLSDTRICIKDERKYNEKALNIYEKLLTNDPDNVAYQSVVAETLNNLGALLSDMGVSKMLRTDYEKALEMRQKILKTDPKTQCINQMSQRHITI